MQCNLREEKEILDMFEKIRVELGGVDICVNNAGLINNAPLLSSPTDKWREMLDVSYALFVEISPLVSALKHSDT